MSVFVSEHLNIVWNMIMGAVGQPGYPVVKLSAKMLGGLLVGGWWA